MQRAFGPFVILVLAIILSACDSAPVAIPQVGVSEDYQVLSGRSGPGLVADPKSPIPDAPKPIGFKPVVDQCKSSFNGVTRSVHHVYQGVGSANEATTFLRQQIPRHGWKFTDFRSATGNAAALVYTKGNEALTATVAERAGVATIVIDITPAGQAPIAQVPAK